MKYTDVMCDIETTGISPDRAAIIQIAAVRFNLETRQVDAGDMFNRCLAVPPTRSWDEGTREWWLGKNRAVLQNIMGRQEEHREVIEAFAKWAGYYHDQPLRMWGKPTHFDYSMLASYFREFEVMNPFHYRHAMDQNSFLRGLARTGEYQNFERQLEFVGDAHNAIFDCLHQIKVIFHALDATAPAGFTASEPLVVEYTDDATVIVQG